MSIYPLSALKTFWINQTPIEKVFTISSIALLVLAPLATFLGIVGGLAFRFCFSSNTKLEKTERIIPPSHTLIVLIGAVTAVVKMTPYGKTASLFITAIPFLSPLALGNVCWRALKLLKL
jgi:hypothetical protein